MRDGAFEGSELTVVVLALASRRNGLYRIPVFDNLALGDTEQIAESRVGLIATAFTDAQEKSTLRPTPCEVDHTGSEGPNRIEPPVLPTWERGHPPFRGCAG